MQEWCEISWKRSLVHKALKVPSTSQEHALLPLHMLDLSSTRELPRIMHYLEQHGSTKGCDGGGAVRLRALFT